MRRPTLVSPSRAGMIRNVAGSGIATMSDSSIALNPVIDEPSKPMPSSSASSISDGVMAKLLRWPSRSVIQNRTYSTPSSCSCRRTSRRASGFEVARSLLSIIAIRSSSLMEKPQARPVRVRGIVASKRARVYKTSRGRHRLRWVKVLLVDDDDRFLTALAALLETMDVAEVVGLAGDGDEAVALAEQLAADVIVMDLDMPRVDGIAATRHLRTRLPHAHVVILSGSDVVAHSAD